MFNSTLRRFLFSARESTVRAGGVLPRGLTAPATHSSEVRRCPSRVRDVPTPLTSLEVWPCHGRGTSDISSLCPQNSWRLCTRNSDQRGRWNRCHQDVKEMSQGPLVSCRYVSGTSPCPAPWRRRGEPCPTAQALTLLLGGLEKNNFRIWLKGRPGSNSA